MTNLHTKSEKTPAQSLGIAISQGFELFKNPQNPVHIQLKRLCSAFNLNAVPVKLFLRGEAIELLQKKDVVQLFEDHFGLQVSLYACSTALDLYQDKNSPALSAQFAIAGLGFWVEETVTHPTLDFSTPTLMPRIIIATASPESALFEEQLDLALATAAFDFEPKLLLQGKANDILTDAFTDTSIGKKMASAEMYGVESILSYEHNHSVLLEAIAHEKDQCRIFEVEATPSTKLGLQRLLDLEQETLYACDRFICL
ncbi:MAG TPA: hypothetical protein DHW71_12390 [Gammaproteobacteria bacterium]|nr:hypothetical protein [Gammaproteobacteria bacterium]HBF07148.1 hypothetical protein [Gammaproteobacteria bacterium]HCK93787.1 hypothetical protein [Gammaproteobacteria bacterium]|tara:strand:- start:11027 stop:11794 length:768 start_codon:yes stop_codon:yes gene_type:complete